MATELHVSQKVPLTGQWVKTLSDGSQEAFTPTEVPSWRSSDETVLTVAPAADGLTCFAIAVGIPGGATVTLSGTQFNPSTVDITITPDEIVTSAIGVGTPVPKDETSRRRSR